jgi:hypothetical protein
MPTYNSGLLQSGGLGQKTFVTNYVFWMFSMNNACLTDCNVGPALLPAAGLQTGLSSEGEEAG